MLLPSSILFFAFPFLASSATHRVSVGKGGLNFSPNSIIAQVGDRVEFQFESSGHSVAAGDFSNACQPLDASAFYSGFVSPGGQPFYVTINNTDPIWYYCTATGHCQNGMVGVINPPAGRSVDDYANAASKTSTSNSPPEVQGGVFGSARSVSGSGSSSTSTSGTSSTTATPSASGASSTGSSSGTTYGSNTGAAAGRIAMSVIGIAIPIGLLAYSAF